jgi:hypothetical protein
MPKFKNIWLALKGQLPLNRTFRNFVITRNAWGMFSKNSHMLLDTGKKKVMYNTAKSAKRSADSMRRKHGKHFSHYKCVFCDGYHLGKNRDNKHAYVKLTAREDSYYQTGTEVFNYDGNRFTVEEWKNAVDTDCFLCRGLNENGEMDGEQCCLDEFDVTHVE